MNSPLVTVLFLAIMSLLTVTLFDQQEAHRADMEARRVAQLIRGIAQLQRAHYQTSRAVDPAARFLTQVQEPALVGTEIDDLSGAAEWDWFHALPDDPAHKTHADDKNRFSTWATRRWLRSYWVRGSIASAPLDNSGLPSPEPGVRNCCVVDPGSVQVIYEARDAHAAGRVARQFGPSACLGQPHTHTATPAENWLSYECADAAGAGDRYAIVHFSAPSSITVVDGFMYNKQLTASGPSRPASRRPMYGDLVLREHRPQGPDRTVGITDAGSTLYDPATPNPVTASIHGDGYVYAPGPPDIRLGETIGFEGYGRRPVQIDANGDLRIGFGADEQILLDDKGLALSNNLGGPTLSLKQAAGTRTLGGAGLLRVQGTAVLDLNEL